MEQRSRRMLFQFGEIPPVWAIATPTADGHKLHQPPPRVPTSINPPPKSDALFSSSLAVAVLVLLSALFFLGVISLYIRRFARRSSTTEDETSAGHHRQGVTHVTIPPPISVLRSSCAAGHKGLDPAAIASMPRSAYGGTAKDEMMCPVCLSEFEEGETVKVIPKCEHVFHVECIDRWLYAHVSCPVCRATQLLNVREKNTSGSVGAAIPTQVATLES